jgi:hypothetical protein
VRLSFSVKSIFGLFLDLQPRFSLFTPCFRLSGRPPALPRFAYFYQLLCSLFILTAPLVVRSPQFSEIIPLQGHHTSWLSLVLGT